MVCLLVSITDSCIFRNILVIFFTEDIEEESLAELVHSLFNLDAHLYTVAMQSGGSGNTLSVLRETTFAEILNKAYIGYFKQRQHEISNPSEVNQVFHTINLNYYRTLRAPSKLAFHQNRLTS